MARKGYVVWLTGLPGAGKTTLCKALEQHLAERRVAVEHLDGDVVRQDLCADLGFTPQDRETNLKRVAYVAGVLSKHGVVVLCSFVSPYRDVRSWLRSSLDNFVEVFVKCSVEECTRRDPKGLYAKALKGEIERFTGISAPYEVPESPEMLINTESETVEQSLKRLVTQMEALGILPVTGHMLEYDPAEQRAIESGLAERGYL